MVCQFYGVSVLVLDRQDVVFRRDREIGAGTYRLTRVRDVGLQSTHCCWPLFRAYPFLIRPFLRYCQAENDNVCPLAGGRRGVGNFPRLIGPDRS
jgi:hypothetical protein